MNGASATAHSLVVMTRNRPEPLRRCLESIERLRWNGQLPEIIVVDDGSNPPAEAVTDRFPSLEIINVRLEHLGVAAARNRGLERSTGECVAFIADDYILPETYLEDADAYLRQNPDAMVITHNIDPQGSNLFSPVQRLYFDLVIGQEVPPDEAGRDVIRSLTLPASRAAMFRRGVFAKLGCFDESLRVGEDGEFGSRMARAGIAVHLFLRKRIIHHDAQSSLDYLRQRLRYGRSYVRSGIAGREVHAFSRRKLLAVMAWQLRRKLRQWWEVSGRLRIRPRFIALSPFLVLFLAVFYYGAYREVSDSRAER
jgi:GT2 family glycosyltransferase